jgi:pyridoxine 5-phosphate synthase
MKLGVNIDHVATLRQARYAGGIDAHNAEPDVCAAAAICERAGAHGITIHLRADRRHIQDADVFRLKEKLATKMNLEMGNTPEILEIALRVKPAEVCLVPENRREVTTEGGLDVAGQRDALLPVVAALSQAGCRVSLFIDPDPAQLRAAASVGAPVVELHTGSYAEGRPGELERLRAAAALTAELGLECHAGHGLTYANTPPVAALPQVRELNIGHFLIGEAIIDGMDAVIRKMREVMDAARA